jgi:predicted Zn-dependent protease
MPGGRIMITTGLLHLLETPDQLLGVIAHESAHILQHHTDQQVLSDQGPLFVLRILASGDSSVLRAIAAPSALLIHDSFSQRYEKEADAYGWNYLVAAGLNPHGEIEALEKLASTDPGDAHLRGLSSHPDMDKRIGWLTEKWDHLPQHDHFIELTNPMPKAED